MPQLIRKTKRLIVRPLQASDYQAWKTAWTAMQTPKNKWDRKNKSSEDVSLGKFRALIKKHKELRKDDNYYALGVFQKKTGELIGTVSVMDVARGIGQSAYLGYSIFNKYWGHGFGKESVLAMIDIAFRDLKLHRLEAGIEPSSRIR